ncbi:MAG TPA: tryptophan synthase subunit alpha [Syntrophorhabdaceae bacterium]|nr:tryptophan synthase subunit alpha [Syntrophorhabdaceae bacterium]HPU30665.1 tryptophan synthase subunit alpha [Syntrophorhabdaceae bacterium]
MNNIVKKFRQLKKEGKKAFIPYITAGDPDLEKTKEILDIFANVGADIIELGVPFSDPMADGPVIQKAMERALKNGVTIKDILDMVRDFKEAHHIPIVLMGYYNPFFQYGLECLGEDCLKSGVDGILIVDMPPEEAKDMKAALKSNGIASIFLATPVTDEARIKKIKGVAEGFIYFVSVTGVTGMREELPEEIKEKIKEIKYKTKLPVVLGFGISNPDTIKKFYDTCDGFVVGSAIVREWHRFFMNKAKREDFINFLERLSSSCHIKDKGK